MLCLHTCTKTETGVLLLPAPTPRALAGLAGAPSPRVRANRNPLLRRDLGLAIPTGKGSLGQSWSTPRLTGIPMAAKAEL